MIDSPDGLILLPRLQVENANAVSGPLTWGFPAPSAFTGFVHALHRKMGNDDLLLDGVGIICHRFDPQVYKPNGKYQYRFTLARHPMGKDGKPLGTIEEGRAHLEVSLLIGVYSELGLEQHDGKVFAQQLYQMAHSMRLAGGSVRPSPLEKRYEADYCELGGSLEGDEKAFRKLRRRLLPGFALIHRHDVLCEYLAELKENGMEANALDALLELVRLNIDPIADDPDKPDNVKWHASRVRPGWLVPIPVGYSAISPLYPPGTVLNARDDCTPFRFVESLYSLGEWISPHRLNNPNQLLWHHRSDPETGLYLVDHHTPA